MVEDDGDVAEYIRRELEDEGNAVTVCHDGAAGLRAAERTYQLLAQATGRAQCVLVHVECGTQALAGAVHNAAKGRAPVLIFAGASPFTQEGELKGSRNEFIQWIQDVFDQRGLVRGYVKYENEVRTGRNVKQLIHRAMQFAHSDPKGPVYLMAAREVLEEQVPAVDRDRVEELFDRAEADRSRAFELKRELDRLGLFREYEDRFLDLFKRPAG